MMLRAIVLQHFHSGPNNPITARQRKRIDVSVRAGGWLADDLRQLVSLDYSHVRLGVTDGPAVSEKGNPGVELWRDRLQIPLAASFICDNVCVIRFRNDRNHPTCRSQRFVGQVRENHRRNSWIAAQVKDNSFSFLKLRQRGLKIFILNSIESQIKDSGFDFAYLRRT